MMITFLADVVQILHNGSQRVSVSRDNHALAGQNGRADLVLPEGQHSLHGVLQALGQGQAIKGEILVSGVLAWESMSV